MLQHLFFDTPIKTNAAMLGTFLFTFMPPFVVAFALTLALKWAAGLENGRLEVLFSTPPVFLGVNWTNFLGMIGVAVVLLVMNLVQFRHADIKLS